MAPVPVQHVQYGQVFGVLASDLFPVERLAILNQTSQLVLLLDDGEEEPVVGKARKSFVKGRVRLEQLDLTQAFPSAIPNHFLLPS